MKKYIQKLFVGSLMAGTLLGLVQATIWTQLPQTLPVLLMPSEQPTMP